MRRSTRSTAGQSPARLGQGDGFGLVADGQWGGDVDRVVAANAPSHKEPTATVAAGTTGMNRTQTVLPAAGGTNGVGSSVVPAPSEWQKFVFHSVFMSLSPEQRAAHLPPLLYGLSSLLFAAGGVVCWGNNSAWGAAWICMAFFSFASDYLTFGVSSLWHGVDRVAAPSIIIFHILMTGQTASWLVWAIFVVQMYAYNRSTRALRNCTHPGMLQEFYIWHSIWHVFGMLSSSTSATCMPGALGTEWTRAAFCHKEGSSNWVRGLLMAFGTLMGARGYYQVHLPPATAARQVPPAS